MHDVVHWPPFLLSMAIESSERKALESQIIALGPKSYGGDRDATRIIIDTSIDYIAKEKGISPQELARAHDALEASLTVIVPSLQGWTRKRAEQKLAADSSKKSLQARMSAVSPTIDVVHVFSGPGTFFKRLKDGQVEWNRGQDLNRFQMGRALFREIAAIRTSILRRMEIATHDLTEEDLQKYAGILFYNGVPEENTAMRDAARRNLLRMPVEHLALSDTVQEDDGRKQTIRHTGDQVRDLLQQLENPESPLHGKRNIALVGNTLDIRLPFYMQKYYQEYLKRGGDPLRFWLYGLPPRRGSKHATGEDAREDTVGPYTAWEALRLVRYGHAGHLATEPVILQNIPQRQQ